MKETELLSPYLHTALLMIYLESSLNLPFFSKTDPSPYVELEVENESKSTDPEPQTCEPLWDKGFTFLIRDPRKAVLNLRIIDDASNNKMGEISFKVDSLKNEPSMDLQRHTFFLNRPYSEASICCSMKLRVTHKKIEFLGLIFTVFQILKNDRLESDTETQDGPKPEKKLVKQESNVSNISKSSRKSNTTELTDFSDDSETSK